MTPRIIIVRTGHARSPLGSRIGLSKEFLGRIETYLEPPGKVTLKVACAVENFAFVERHLLKNVVFPRDSLLFLQEQIVGARHLIMLIILDESGGLLEIFACEVIPQLLDELGDYGDAIFADNDAFHFN